MILAGPGSAPPRPNVFVLDFPFYLTLFVLALPYLFFLFNFSPEGSVPGGERICRVHRLKKIFNIQGNGNIWMLARIHFCFMSKVSKFTSLILNRYKKRPRVKTPLPNLVPRRKCIDALSTYGVVPAYLKGLSHKFEFG
jgi:hypothetical protein